MEQLMIARRIVDTTYTIVHQPKLFLPAVNSIYEAFDITMNGILESKGVKFDMNNHDEKINLFENNFQLDNHTLSLIKKLRLTLDEHKNASVEFVRDEKFIISDNDYHMTALSLESVKGMISYSEKYIDALYAKL
ncbi:MAG TPA: hypothetical protein VEC16_02305 [Alphaproteobacteria bacterium]|nr:hypothetical protein [Alphaproteobacteria bacterium]